MHPCAGRPPDALRVSKHPAQMRRPRHLLLPVLPTAAPGSGPRLQRTRGCRHGVLVVIRGFWRKIALSSKMQAHVCITSSQRHGAKTPGEAEGTYRSQHPGCETAYQVLLDGCLHCCCRGPALASPHPLLSPCLLLHGPPSAVPGQLRSAGLLLQAAPPPPHRCSAARPPRPPPRLLRPADSGRHPGTSAERAPTW